MKKIMIFSLICMFMFTFIACDQSTTTTTEPINTSETTSQTQTSSETTTTGDENMIYKGTYDRSYPSYYKPGEALIEDAKVVYINWDGFARYYYDALLTDAMNIYAPTLSQIIQEGVFFNNLHNTMPSITNPVQNQILSGGTSFVTGNVYRYYDRNLNKVIQQQRDNKSDTIVNVALNEGLSVMSFSHYLAEPYLTSTNPEKLYVYPDLTNPEVVARGDAKSGDFFSRFEQLERLINQEPIKTNGNTITVTELPNLIVMYCDDLDAIGHNEKDVYGYTRQLSEVGRMNNVITLLKEMDQKLGSIIQEAKDAGVYDQMTFFLTTDHGMTPFGAASLDDPGDHVMTKFGELKNFLQAYNDDFEVEFVAAGNTPASKTTVVAVGANLNIQLTFKQGITDTELASLKEALLTQYYVGKVMTRQELEEAGYWTDAADMIISPKDRYCFSASMLGQYIVRGQHDSLADTANHIVGWIWGKGIKKNYIYEDVAYNYDFGVTIAAALGIVLPEANGIVLDVFDKTE